MKKHNLDIRLIVGLLVAHILINFSFHDKAIFWYIFSGSLLVLIAYATLQGDVDDEVPFIKYFFLGVVSGFVLYLVFWLGIQAMALLHIPFENSLKKLYKLYAPSLFWQYIALLLVAAPGEELFWRGFIQKNLMKYFRPLVSIVIAALLYASVHIYSGSFLLVLAAFLSGLTWGFLYYWKKSMPLIIVSHLVFDIMIFIILPLK
ncbi:type II CAAX endopeptidase family protein [Neobacillus sp. PS2-9]|uniref:CPBP family intramembrane glutamic endopeptidase n=1 Tax=Neobacillus sp. PS2-9 TaxID=3070676 RepID=UPI0027DF48B5|nr:type II CAAX endopeptidase family protein [Neobacillus sp. PS2-9]WML56977.1 type II CAAX endopeptidase family protein [Neobacillus sp. PS2-9]